MKNTVVILGVVFSIVFLTLALKDTNFAEISHAFGTARYWPMIPMFVSLFGFYWLKAVRWSAFLSPSYQVSGIKLVPAMMAGAAGNNLLPAHFGEFVRVYFAGKKYGIPKSTVFASIVIERLFDIVAVLFIFSLALLTSDYPVAFYWAAAFLLVAAIALTALSLLFTIHTEFFVKFVENQLPFLSDAIKQKIIYQITNLSTGLLAIRQRKLYVGIILNSLAQWLLMALCFYCALLAFEIDASPSVAILILGFMVVGISLPTSPGFFGTIEYCFVLALGTVGVDPSLALSAAIYYHFPAWIAVTAAGLILLRVYHISFSETRAELDNQ